MRDPRDNPRLRDDEWLVGTADLFAPSAERPAAQSTTMPCPPELDPVKWAALSRRERRALMRHREKIVKRAGS